MKAQARHGFSEVDETEFGSEACGVKFAFKAVVSAILLLAMGSGVWLVWNAHREGVFEILLKRQEPKSVPDAEGYAVLVAELGRWQKELRNDYATARTADEKAAVEHDARVILEFIMPEMMRCWVGTPYDFNGTTEKPGRGTVACGYYVSTVIRDAGFHVDRYKLAQQPSENIMRTFLKSDECQLKVGEDYAKYADWVERKARGIYLIGMDTHVGFIVNGSDGLHFFHSSSWNKRGVVEEARKRASALRSSHWRMLGGLTADASVIQMWLDGEKINVKTR